MVNGECVLTIPISTNTALRTPFLYHAIDQVIDSTAGCVLLSFLDCYSGYHQIALKELDQEKMSFNTMMFGLKNASATYQKAI